MFALERPARLAAVLDWEMATIGDPLADLGYLCMMWTEAGDPTRACATRSAASRARRASPPAPS